MLTAQQKSILKLLSQGYSYTEIAQRVGIKQECLHTHCFQIREKTGIVNTKNSAECRKYWTEVLPLKERRFPDPHMTGPTKSQLEAMSLKAGSYSVAQMASTLGICNQAVHNHISLGCKRAKCRTDARSIREWLEADKVRKEAPLVQDSLLSDPAFQ
jgi:predicted DNA-binding protein YlxM (UPF0122 family)